ncbi:DUF2887 domain-containing protein [Phormidium sp. FACHB-322]|uniref:DUF2887 domain-containing protein n=1 Tax=unclassified Phormidium TaxID=2609805 RepID=UPI001687C247|nr:DUF2887 domain-containing protein [Phormidium sp. FACHB-77]MBD2029289.1 DUF2887 domain-containing protein [Phormidium sp. FACHB-322]MBD2049279.1 DUF2887 domain-containing protein [Leptolyngbya sp. FACHB-60]
MTRATKDLLEQAKGEGEQDFRTILNLIEAILINKFPRLNTQETLKMLDIKLKPQTLVKLVFIRKSFKKDSKKVNKGVNKKGAKR